MSFYENNTALPDRHDYQNDGSAVVKEVPDRGERQTAAPVKDESLEAPKKGR